MRGSQEFTEFPKIINVSIAGDIAAESADYWRGEGYLVTVAPRVVKAKRARVTVHVVVLTGRKKS